VTTTLFLLTQFVCGLTFCSTYYEVHPTWDTCVAALASWRDHTPFWPFAYSRGGYCSSRELTPEDVAAYRSRSYR
jgi:hypothetical protein